MRARARAHTHTHTQVFFVCLSNIDSDWSSECASNRVNVGRLLNTYSCNAALMMISKVVKTCLQMMICDAEYFIQVQLLVLLCTYIYIFFFYCSVQVSCTAKLYSSSRVLGQGAFLHMWISTVS
jgi:hypothetical protein